MGVLQVVLALVVPAGAIWLASRSRVAGALGPVVLCYAAGILLANSMGAQLDRGVALTASEVAVPLALPLMLFSTELGRWRFLGRSLALSFLTACIAAVTSAATITFLFREHASEWWKVAAMLVGVYVGGTANMTAIGLALGAKSEVFAILNAADVLAGGAYLLFLLSVAQRMLGTVLPAFVHPGEEPGPLVERFAPGSARKRLGSSALAFLMSAAIVASSIGASFLLFKRLEAGFVLMALTALALGASLVRRVRLLEGSYELGEYVLLTFCFSVGSLADLRLAATSSPWLFAMVFMVMILAIVLHLLAARLLRLDVDTTLITSTATIFGPAFIGPVATALRNRHLVAPGVTLGLAGIALGNFLGLFTAWLIGP